MLLAHFATRKMSLSFFLVLNLHAPIIKIVVDATMTYDKGYGWGYC